MCIFVTFQRVKVSLAVPFPNPLSLISAYQDYSFYTTPATNLLKWIKKLKKSPALRNLHVLDYQNEDWERPLCSTGRNLQIYHCCKISQSAADTLKIDAVLNLKLHFKQNIWTAWTTSSPTTEKLHCCVKSIDKIQSIIKSVNLQSFKQSLSNFGSQTIPLFKKPGFEAYPNHKYWKDYCNSFTSLIPLLSFSRSF